MLHHGRRLAQPRAAGQVDDRGRRAGARTRRFGGRPTLRRVPGCGGGDAPGGFAVRRSAQNDHRQPQLRADAHRDLAPAVLEPVLLGPGGEGDERRVASPQTMLGDEARREALFPVAEDQAQRQRLAGEPEGVREVRVLQAGAPGRGAVTGHGAGHQHPAALLRAEPDAHGGAREPCHPSAAQESLQIERDIESGRPKPRAEFPKRTPERPPASGPDHALPRGTVPDDDLVETLVMFDHAAGVGFHRPRDMRCRIAAPQGLDHGRCQQHVAARGEAHEKDGPGRIRERKPRSSLRAPRSSLGAPRWCLGALRCWFGAPRYWLEALRLETLRCFFDRQDHGEDYRRATP